MTKTQLLRCMRTMARADEHPVRTALFDSVSRRRLWVRAAIWLHRRLANQWAGSWFIGLYGLKTYLLFAPPRSVAGKIMSVAVFANERRQVDAVRTSSGGLDVLMIAIGMSALRRPDAVLRNVGTFIQHPRHLVRALRIFARLNRRQASFLVACRSASAIAFYLQARRALLDDRPCAVLVSSDSNPEPLGLTWASKALNVPTIFVSHAYTTPVSPPLAYDLAILEGEAALSRYQAKGPVPSRIVLRGVDGVFRDMDPARLRSKRPVVGVFPPKELNWSVMRRVLDDALGVHGASKVLIRWHPNMMETPRISEHPGRIEFTSCAASVTDVAVRCDWVVAADCSNVHLSVLKAGVPTIPIKNFSVLPEDLGDLYGFVGDGLIPPATETLAAVALADAAAFYRGDWRDRFRRHDASYGRGPDEMQAAIAAALSALSCQPPYVLS